MDDLISKQAAIAALGERPLTWVGGDYELGRQNQFDSDLLAIENVPSMQPEQRWVPVSERLPKIPIRVQVQLDNNWIITAYYDESEWYAVPGDDEPIDGVLAWMPLPELWKGAQNGLLN